MFDEILRACGAQNDTSNVILRRAKPDVRIRFLDSSLVLRMKKVRIATASVRTGFAMTKYFYVTLNEVKSLF